MEGQLEKWTVENADDDLEAFIAEAPEGIFYERFSGWFGKRENFQYAKYAHTLSERRFQAKRRGEYEIPVFSVRNARSAYKIGMAKMEAMLQKERDKHATMLQDDPFRVFHCLRCMLVNRGTIFINKNNVCTCKISFVPQSTDVNESQVNIHKSIDETIFSSNDEYLVTLALSTAAMTVENTPSVQENKGPSSLIKARKISEPQTFVEQTSHRCIVPKELKFSGTEVCMLKHPECNTKPVVANTLIYAPSGFGKTSLQHWLMRQGILVADTDDMPETTVGKVLDRLKYMSILTNRLDIVKAVGSLVIAFIPDDKAVLRARTAHLGLTEEDIDYWYQEHEQLRVGDSSVRCRIRTTCVSDWFEPVKVWQNCKLGIEKMLDIQDRIEYAYNASDPVNFKAWGLTEQPFDNN